MSKFKGFTDSETFTRLPDTFFHQLLSQIEDTAELKVILHTFWRVEHMDGSFPAFRETDFDTRALGLSSEDVRRGIERAVKRGAVLKAEHKGEVLYFLNSPRGRGAANAFLHGEHKVVANPASHFERTNIFRLYEENIGPLTPLIADALKDAEETYSAEWIAEAIDLAVKNNKRSWRYCEAILKRWKEEGRGEKQDRRDTEANRDKYIKGEYADYIEH
ncbi:MAG TPA: DnaD domain protein [Anaerolineales bacterium]|nr:DnaD domain protein [Anaerolineales bacterium]